MASGKGTLLRMLGGLVLGEAQVVSVDAPGPRFRRVRLAQSSTADDRYQPGDKLQILLPGDDVRTYTPVGWAGRSTTLLAWLHGAGPGARWAGEVGPGATIRYVGPQRSLSLPEGPVVLVGDETSIAVAAAYALARPGQVGAVLEAEDPAEVAQVAAALGLTGAVVVRRDPADPGRSDLVAQALAQARELGARVGVTGGSALVQAARAGLRAGGVDARVKGYWAPGRSGLD